MYVNRVAVHSLLCISRAALRQHACSTREVLILRVHSFSLSLLSLILTSTYPVTSHRINYTYCWFRTVKLHILLASHPSPTPNDVNGGTCFAQVAEDIRIKNQLPPCRLCIYHSYPPCFAGADFPIQSLISSVILVHSYLFLFPSLFVLSISQQIKWHRSTEVVPFLTRQQVRKPEQCITHFWCCSEIAVVRAALHISSRSSYNISGQDKMNKMPLRHLCIMLPKGSSWGTISGGLIAGFSPCSCVKYQNHKGLLPFKSS